MCAGLSYGESDRQTVGQTCCHGIVCAMHMRRAAKIVDMSREHRRVTDGCTNKQRPVPMIYCHTNTKDERRHDGPANVTDRQTDTHTHTHTHTQTKDRLINRQTHKHVLEGMHYYIVTNRR